MSAIKELLGKEAHELSDEELAELIRGNRPRIAEPKEPKTKKIKPINPDAINMDNLSFFIGDDDDEETEEDDFLNGISLSDAEGRK
jgi:hypothetical protein